MLPPLVMTILSQVPDGRSTVWLFWIRVGPAASASTYWFRAGRTHVH
jgi:hypothetical protein